jgi:arylsulfatase A-like enzyme
MGRHGETNGEEQGAVVDRKATSPESARFQTVGRDAYDNCLAYLDGQLGELFNELQRGGEFGRTLIIVTSDHGEGFGEHDLFDHGESLYQTEISVPLVIVAPARSRSQAVVSETVSLRNLPATIVELADLEAASPFPGPSLAKLWRKSSADPGSLANDEVVSELSGPNPSHPTSLVWYLKIREIYTVVYGIRSGERQSPAIASSRLSGAAAYSSGSIV